MYPVNIGILVYVDEVRALKRFLPCLLFLLLSFIVPFYNIIYLLACSGNIVWKTLIKYVKRMFTQTYFALSFPFVKSPKQYNNTLKITSCAMNLPHS